VPEDCGHTFQANYKCPCYSYYVTIPINLDANTNLAFIYACPKVLGNNNVVACSYDSPTDFAESKFAGILMLPHY